jgi:uncharacterized protein GlcG (DUF336 family)
MTDSQAVHTMPETLSPRNALSLATAQRVAEAALARAAELGFAVTAAVHDDGGHLIALHRADGCALVAIDTAQVKARTAILFGTATANLPGAQPMIGIMGAAATTPLALFPGGIPLGADGVLIGAVGVSGGTPDVDLQAAIAAADAVSG